MNNRWIPLLALLLSLISTARFAIADTPPTSIAIVAVHGEVNDYTRNRLEKQFREARQAGAKTVILDIDTYGGLVVSGLDITHFLRTQSDLHVIAYVNRAISAGAMIAVSCDEIVMAPSAVLGDCAPIIFNSDDTLHPLPAAERAKEESPILNDFDASADHAGYSRLLLESMVAVDRVVYYVQNPKTHEKRFVDQAEFEKLASDHWEPVQGVPSPVDGPQTLLTVQTDEAVKLGLATGVAASAEGLAGQRGRLVANLTPGAGEAIVQFLSLGAFRSFVMTLLFICLCIIFWSPGHGMAESASVLALAVLLGVPLLTGYANWWEVVIILGGLGLLAFEVFVFPGHGVSAIVGILMIIAGLLMTFVGPNSGGGIVPNSSVGWMNFRHGAMAMGGSAFASIALMIWLSRYLPKLPFFGRLVLNTTGSNPLLTSSAIPPENAWPGVGTSGIAVTDLRPGGSAEFLDLSVGDNRPIAVVSESGYVSAGTQLIVRESRGNRIVVRAAAT